MLLKLASSKCFLNGLPFSRINTLNWTASTLLLVNFGFLDKAHIFADDSVLSSINFLCVWCLMTTADDDKSLELMRKFSEQYARRSGTYFCVDKGVTAVVIKVKFCQISFHENCKTKMIDWRVYKSLAVDSGINRFGIIGWPTWWNFESIMYSE